MAMRVFGKQFARCAAWAVVMFSGLLQAQEYGGMKHDFKINNGLVRDVPETNPLARYPALMRAEVTDQKGRRHHLSFHRITFTGPEPPVFNVYDRDSGCVIGTADFPGLDVDSFDVLRRYAILNGAESACDGKTFTADNASLGYAFKLRFKRQSKGTYALTVYKMSLRDYSAADVLASGTARTTAWGDELLQAKRTPVQPARTSGGTSQPVRSLDGIYLATNFGIFRGTSRDAATGKSGFILVEGTDINRPRSPGDLKFSASLSPQTQTLVMADRVRVGDGRRCPDRDDDQFTSNIRMLPTREGTRVWALDPLAASNQRYCAIQRVNLRTCKVVGCSQWSDSLSEVQGDQTWYLTDSEANARQIYARLPRWTLANRGVRSSTSKSRAGRNDSSAPWGECGLEGCDARRRREEMDNLLIDMWNR